MVDGKQPQNEHPISDSSEIKPEDFSVLYEELKRKHHLLLTVWNSIDVKIGVLLGFTAVILFGIILNNEGVDSTALNTHFVWPFTSYIYIVNFVAFWIFWAAFLFFILVTIVGMSALHIKTFDDIDTIDEIKRFLGDDSITSVKFKQKIGRLLYDNIKGFKESVEEEIIVHIGNEKIVRKKAEDVRLMIYLFVSATILFLIWFFAEIFKVR